MNDRPIVVLAHGLFGLGEIKIGPARLSYFRLIDRAIEGDGYPLITPRVHPTGSIQTRAAQLKAQILNHLDTPEHRGRKVVILAHSMGGLDARHMITHLGMHQHVTALATICTPHRGSSFADFCLRHLDRRLQIHFVAAKLGWDIGALRDLTCESCASFNDCTPNHPDVRYLSVGAARPWTRVPIFLVPSHRIIGRVEGENDGLVSVASSRWGRYIDTWPADHLLTVNKRMVPGCSSSATVVGWYRSLLARLRGETVFPDAATI